MLTAGFGKVCISPETGAPLAGFAAREGVCEGIHDDLFSRAIVIENDGRIVVFVSIDVLAVSSEFVERVRTGIQTKTGIDKDSIMIACTHTHAGPVTIRTFFNPEDSLDGRFMDFLAESVENSVVDAWESRFPARIGVGRGSVEGIGVNRRSPERKPTDEEIGIIKIDDAHGKTRGVLFNYSCHPTVLGSNNLLATGDFPYFAVAKIERTIGGDGFALFVNGTQGNISMGHSSELSAIGVITPGRTFEHAEELGERLAESVINALDDIETRETCLIDSARKTVAFPLKNFPDLTTAAADLASADDELSNLDEKASPPDRVMHAKSKRLYASITDFYARETSSLNGYLPVELQAFRISGNVFLAVPAEVFVEIGLELKRRSRHRIFIVGIANGYIGYLPTEKAFAEGGYEVVSSKVAPSSESVLYEEAALLENMIADPNVVQDPHPHINGLT